MTNFSIKMIFAKIFAVVFFALSASIMFVLITEMIGGLFEGEG